MPSPRDKWKISQFPLPPPNMLLSPLTKCSEEYLTPELHTCFPQGVRLHSSWGRRYLEGRHDENVNLFYAVPRSRTRTLENGQEDMQ